MTVILHKFCMFKNTTGSGVWGGVSPSPWDWFGEGAVHNPQKRNNFLPENGAFWC